MDGKGHRDLILVLVRLRPALAQLSDTVCLPSTPTKCSSITIGSAVGAAYSDCPTILKLNGSLGVYRPPHTSDELAADLFQRQIC
jgi:hypothetical protein